MKIKIIIIFHCILIISTSIFGVTITPDKKIKLSQKVLLQFPLSFCVTEDGLILISDFKAGDVKIYNNSGELVKVLGREGYGPNEFAKPFFCFYIQRKFIIADSGQRRIFFYERRNKFDFVRTKEVLPPSIGFQFYIENKKLFIAGTVRDKNTEPYEFYMINLEKDNQYTYYLPGHMKYGFNSTEQYNTHLLKKPELSTIGTHAQFDIQGNFAYYVWEGDLKIFKINLETKDIKTFGEKTSYYIKPFASQKLINAFQTMQFALISKERKKMTYVKKIFTTQQHVLLIYEVHDKNQEDPGYMIQFYTLDGNFIKELRIQEKVSWVMWFDKQKNVLYSIQFETDEEADQTHYIVSYKISE